MTDKINPEHYKYAGEHEPIRVVEDWGLGFKAGNALKYIARAGKKDGASTREDLEKAMWYLRRLYMAEEAHRAFQERRSPALKREWLHAREDISSGYKGVPRIEDVASAWGIHHRLRDVVKEISRGCWDAAVEYLEQYLKELP